MLWNTGSSEQKVKGSRNMGDGVGIKEMKVIVSSVRCGLQTLDLRGKYFGKAGQAEKQFV